MIRLIRKSRAKANADQAVRGVQGYMALDIHMALGHPVDHASENQGHRSWGDWWAELVAEVRRDPSRAAVQQLLNAQEAMLRRWAEAAPPGQRLSDVQQELWRALHKAADGLREALDRPTEETDRA